MEGIIYNIIFVSISYVIIFSLTLLFNGNFICLCLLLMLLNIVNITITITTFYSLNLNFFIELHSFSVNGICSRILKNFFLFFKFRFYLLESNVNFIKQKKVKA